MTLYFSDCQTGAASGCVAGNNANAGTQASPKRDLSGINVNNLGAGSQLFFARGGSWNIGQLELANNNVSASNPLVLDAWGSGVAPTLRSTSAAAAIQLGGRWGNTDNDGGYVLRNLRIDGLGTGQTGIWLLHNVHDVTIENVEITGFWIGIYGTPGSPYGVNNVSLRNSTIRRNGSMGWLGGADNLTIDNVLFEANNFNGDPRNHALYLSHSDNVRITNNRFIRNSVVNGQCTGGNVTVHGVVNGMTIENNLVEQDASAMTCYGMAITSGYDSVETFRNTVVRGNTIVNLGLCSICVNSAPGIVIENNRSINTRATYHVGVVEPANGEQDVASTGAVVRNNTLCQTTPVSGAAAAAVGAIGAILSGNVTLTGASASTGVCAR
ncbi:right-handed parallel beta-helix repeat-containing protein [uncultured Methylibium sp.]|uniref:right-handed parallel beta-helix repeat-containing protein n=1 Tax=uncultured Methylibium sp. TaxID=381093 RepID=UPI0025DF1626|nr:right-handed parallel beta-helix repeat-containing protein [uncultured Methylibium sp.]